MKKYKKSFRIMVINDEDAVGRIRQFLYYANIWHIGALSKKPNDRKSGIILLRCNNFMYDKIKQDYLLGISYLEF